MQGLMDFPFTHARRLALATSIVAVAFIASALVSGCDSDLQQQLDGKKTERYNKAAAELAEVEKNRITALTDSLPKEDAKPEGRRHPLMTWRSEFYTGKVVEGEEAAAKPPRDDEGALEKIADTYKGTPT
ncbi:MAG: hypothetical protein VX938_00170, partial [Myxococcota bacterium]|nr:hypothetical protein [Myxococcota bacterium]